MRREMRRLVRVVALCATAALCCSLAAIGPAHAGTVHAAGDVDVVTPVTGGEFILSTTARNGGSGAWTTLSGPELEEGVFGDFWVGMRIGLYLPDNVEWNTARTSEPEINVCHRAVSRVTYPSSRLATVELLWRLGAPFGPRCRIDYGRILQVRPIDNRASAPSPDGTYRIVLTTLAPGALGALVADEDVGSIRVIGPPPTVFPATGGEAIPSTTARIGGDGSWTRLTGPRFVETVHDGLPAGGSIEMVLPPGFEWNTANASPPLVSGCDRTIHAIIYPTARLLRLAMVTKTGVVPLFGLCTIDFGTLLQVRPVDAAATDGTSGDIEAFARRTATSGNIFVLGSAGRIAMVATPPPAVTLSLAAVAPTAINGAILWGEAVDLVTTGPAGTMFSLQVTTDNETWTTLADAAGTPLAFTIGADGTSTYRYRPVRNYWYRAVAGTSLSNTPRVTVRQTIVIRPIHDGTRHVATGTAVTFTATVRPAGPALPTATVRFELYRNTGSRWVLSRSVAVAVDLSGVASTTFTFARGSWYVRAQAQPTAVNANSLWTPSQYYTAP